MLTKLCRELNNWFETGRVIGKFKIIDGRLDGVNYLQDGQFFRIVGSLFNDGVHQFPCCELSDEIFVGGLWPMAIPEEVLELAEEIDAWSEKYGAIDSASMSPYQSESFGGYSYSKGSAAGGGVRNGTAWADTFSERLDCWRKIRP